MHIANYELKASAGDPEVLEKRPCILNLNTDRILL